MPMSANVFKSAAIAVAVSAVLSFQAAAQTQKPGEIEISYQDKKFTSVEVSIPANTAVTFRVKNLSAKAMEFERKPLKIEKIIAADNRADLTIACHAFDRVFRAGRYWVPQWYAPSHRVAYWDVFDHPKKLPRYQVDSYSSGMGERTLWWYVADKAAKLEQAK